MATSSLVSALRRAASAMGISPAEYEPRIAAGERLCRRCRKWRPRFAGSPCPQCKDAHRAKRGRWIDAAMEGRRDG